MPLWAQIVSAVVAVCGFLLGIWNAWFLYRKDATRFVVAANMRERTRGAISFKATVSNRGNSPLFIRNFWLTNGKYGKPKLKLKVHGDFGGNFFKEAIEARDSKTFVFDTHSVRALASAAQRGNVFVGVTTKDAAVRRAKCKSFEELMPTLVKLAAIEEQVRP